MEIIMDKTEISCRREIWNSCVRREEMFDCVVPDTFPDISDIIDICGDTVIRGKEATDGEVAVEGAVLCTVLYTGEGEERELLRLNAEIPFSITVDVPEADSETDIVALLNLEQLEVKLLNPRKILIKSEIVAKLRCYIADSLTLVTDVNDVSGLCLKRENAKTAPVTEVREKTFVISDEMAMPPMPEGYESILCHNVSLGTQDIKYVGNKLIFKGEAVLNVMAKPNGDVAPLCFSTTSSFSQIVELQNPPEDECSEVVLCLTACYFTLDEDENQKPVTTVELHLLAQAITSAKTEFSYISDAYSNSTDCSLEKTEVELPQCSETVVVRDTLRALLETSEAVSETICAQAVCGAVIIDDGAVTANVSVRVVYVNAEGVIKSAEKLEKIKIETELGDGNSCAQIVFGEIYAAPITGGIDIRIPVEALITYSASESVAMVTDISLSETSEKCRKPSIVIIPDCGKFDLWELAKKYSSTIELIEKGYESDCGIVVIPVQNK